MKWFWWVFLIPLFGFTRLYTEYENKKVDAEMKNVEDNLQGVEYSVVKDTPALTEIRDGQILIFSSGTVNKLIWRVNQEIYTINGSCVTIRR